MGNKGWFIVYPFLIHDDSRNLSMVANRTEDTVVGLMDKNVFYCKILFLMLMYTGCYNEEGSITYSSLTN